jgi:hypothetical protein
VKAAKTRALRKRAAHKPPVHPVHKRKPAAKAKKAHKAPVHRSAAAVKAAKARGLSPGAVSCCSAIALTASLRLAGWPAGAEDVLDLYRLTADSPDAGASIVATLDAAYLFGLAGVRPLSFTPALLAEVGGAQDEELHEAGDDGPGPEGGRYLPGHAAQHNPLASHPPAQTRYRADGWWNRTTWKRERGLWHHLAVPADSNGSPALLANPGTSLILGLDLPEGRHAVAADPAGGVWSWGGLYDLTGEAVTEEAWLVTWPRRAVTCGLVTPA